MSTSVSAARARVRGLGPQHGVLLGVLALSATLNLHRLSQNGYANVFYSAAVKSMLRSWHNFFFVSFDPGGLLTVDKPPIALWVQAASAKLFGFGPLSLLVPEAIAAVLCVLVLYRVVSRRFGALAGLTSALALAVFPSFVAISRDNGPDAVLILLMTLACASALRASETGRLRSLLLAAIWVGLAFNTKSLAAYLVVPALALAFLVCSDSGFVRRLLLLAAAGVLLALVSFSWSIVVDATPASQRPYVGGSTNNSEFGLAFHYNGLGRVGGQVGGPGKRPARELLRKQHGKKAQRSPTQRPQHNYAPVVFGGPTGPTRLIRNNLGSQGGWMLPFALLGMVAIALRVKGRRDPRLAALIAFGGWFLTEAVILSLSNGIVHPYYVSALGPGVAAMVGAGAVSFAELIRRRRLYVIAFAAAVAATLAVQVAMLHRDHYLSALVPIVIALSAASLVICAVRRRWATAGVAVAVAALLFAPAVYSWTLWEVPTEGTFPAAGPHAAGGSGGIGVSPPGRKVLGDLLAYVETHGPTKRWPLLTEASTTAAPMILLGVDAGAMGGYGATDPALDAPGLARLVRRGDARYVVLGGAYADRGGNAASRAVPTACPLVRTATWRGRIVPVSRYSFHLYDCAGRAAQLQFIKR
ncbi:MAG: glycosyltransferase family 39 protein [Solirubrobacteraceae bacterium]